MLRKFFTVEGLLSCQRLVMSLDVFKFNRFAQFLENFGVGLLSYTMFNVTKF